jgi:uncharacterized repeat protein (TIGR03803 family)
MKKIILAAIISLSLNFAKAQPELWSVAASGGDDFGVLYSMTPGNTFFNQQYNHTGNSGENPRGSLVEAPNGKFYGMTYLGGFFTSGSGILYEYDPSTGVYTVLKNFFLQTGNQPFGSLVVGPSGNLYGVASVNGTSSGGTLFEYNIPTNSLNILHNFSMSTGGFSMGTPMFASNGKIYGLTRGGGSSSNGVLYEYDLTTSTYTKKHDFVTITGTMPWGHLIQASNGKLYGMTEYGGLSNLGTLFEYDITSSTFTKLRDFNSTSGGRPEGGLLEESGKLYGLNSTWGSGSWGTLFEYNIATTSYSVRVNFNNGTNGGSPMGSLIKATNGKLYGLTNGGGTSNKGVIFEFDMATNTFVKKMDLGILTTGTNPYGSFMQASNGKLYAMTFFGGKNNAGTIFEYDFATNTASINVHLGGDAKNPRGTLLHASNNKLYGMTFSGGANNYGVIYEYDHLANVYTKKYDLSTAVGTGPYGSLIEATNGKFYGLGRSGGSTNMGTIFEYNVITNTCVSRYDFSVAANGNIPMGSPMQAANGKIYGLTVGGGTNSVGVLFEFDITTNTYTKKFDFSSTQGQNPYGSLIETSPGILYGMTQSGGTNNSGTIFEYNYLTNTHTKKYDFVSASGSGPQGSLIKATNGKLYGVTYFGGANSGGVIFEYDIATSTYTKKFDLGNTGTGLGATGSLCQSVNGKLYGHTFNGGVGFMLDGWYITGGTIFEYDIATNTCSSKVDFQRFNGAGPDYTQFIEICTLPQTPSSVSAANIMCVGDAAIKALSISAVSNATAYAWTLPAGATIISGNTTNSITADFSSLAIGVYTLGVNGINICGNGPASVATLSVSACTGVKDLEKGILVSNYPNPFADYLMINAALIDSKGIISIYNNLGQLVSKTTGVSLENKINTSHLSAGVYLLEVKLDGKIISEKVIKQ